MKIGKVYKIIHDQSNICYVGSTFNTLRDRWKNHKERYGQYKNNKSRNMSIHEYFDRYGIEHFKIILIKEYIVVDRGHLEALEQLWINKLNSINVQSSFNPFKRSSKMQYQARKEKMNIKCNCECGGTYYARHEKKHKSSFKHKYLLMSEQEKKNYNKDKEEKVRKKIQLGAKHYREKNHEKIKEKFQQIQKCECGGSYYTNNSYKKNRHEQTKKHQKYIMNNIDKL
jgi:hypothetical protein